MDRKPRERSSVQSRLSELEERLGKAPDGVIATELGIARKTVVAYRKRKGIPPYRTPSAHPPAPARMPRPSRLDAFRALVGQVSDREVAERAGVTPENVRMYRLRRGIQAAWRDAAEPIRTPQWIWKVSTLQGGQPQAIALRAVDIRQALQEALTALAAAPEAEIVGLERVGPYVEPT